MKAVIVPVKSTGRAKRRMARLLTLEERRRLSVAMLTDVARCLSESCVPEVFVVTDDPTVVQLAPRFGLSVLKETSQVSESQSVDQASRHLEQRGFRQILRLPADVPLVQPQDIADLFGECDREKVVVLCPSRDGTGTNALLRSPGTVIPSFFGVNSLRLHLSAAEAQDCEIKTIVNPRIELDIDTLDDILSFLDMAREGETLRLLNNLHIRTRCTATRSKN